MVTIELIQKWIDQLQDILPRKCELMRTSNRVLKQRAHLVEALCGVIHRLDRTDAHALASNVIHGTKLLQ